MPVVHAKQGDHFEAIIRRFKRACEKAGILTKLRQIARYEKPSIKRAKAAAAAVKRHKKKMEKEAPMPSRGKRNKETKSGYNRKDRKDGN